MTFADHVARQAGISGPWAYDAPDVRDDSPLMRQIAAQAKTDPKCKHCGHPIYERPATLDEREHPYSTTAESTVWDLVYVEYRPTTTCHGTAEEFGTPYGHQPTP